MGTSASRFIQQTLTAPRCAYIALVALASLSFSAHALFDDDEARKRIEQTNQRLNQLESQIDTRLTALEQQKSAQAVLELSTQIDGIRADIAKLRGQIEVLTYELSEAQKRQRDLYTDLDSRLQRLEGGGNAAAASVASTTNAPARDEASEQKSYNDAMEQFKRGDYNGAASAFSAFITTYPQSLLVSSAQYWVGNAKFAQRDYRATVAAQTELLKKYPDSPKAADAMLNLASAQAELGDKPASRKTLQDLVAKYPSSDAAAKAKQRLR